MKRAILLALVLRAAPAWAIDCPLVEGSVGKIRATCRASQPGVGQVCGALCEHESETCKITCSGRYPTGTLPGHSVSGYCPGEDGYRTWCVAELHSDPSLDSSAA